MPLTSSRRRRSRPRSDSLACCVRDRGGVSPTDVAFLAHYSGVRDARECGWPLFCFRSGSRMGLDTIAAEMVSCGEIVPPEGVCPAAYLCERIEAGGRSAVSDVSAHHDYRRACEEYDRARWEAETAGMTPAAVRRRRPSMTAPTRSPPPWTRGAMQAMPAVTIGKSDISACLTLAH